MFYVSIAGNHSRIGKKDESRTGERLDDLVEWYLHARLAGNSRITIGYGDKIDPTMYLLRVRGLTYVGIHGDYDAGISALRTANMPDEPVYAILTGHLHHNKYDSEQDVVTVMAGSFLGTDRYAANRRLKSRPEQIVCVCSDKGIESAHFVALNY